MLVDDLGFQGPCIPQGVSVERMLLPFNGYRAGALLVVIQCRLDYTDTLDLWLFFFLVLQ